MTALYVLANCLLGGGAQATVRGEVIPIELVGSGACIRWRLRSRGGAVTSHNPFLRRAEGNTGQLEPHWAHFLK